MADKIIWKEVTPDKIEPMYYRDGYKYQLSRNFKVELPFAPPKDISTDYISFTKPENENDKGLLSIRKGYAWDGCSGPTKDDKSNMTAGLIHDALYQLIRLGLLWSGYREYADNVLRGVCILRGMNKIRAWYYFQGVDHFASWAARPGAEKTEKIA